MRIALEVQPQKAAIKIALLTDVVELHDRGRMAARRPSLALGAVIAVVIGFFRLIDHRDLGSLTKQS
jgi:hypothetical protein